MPDLADTLGVRFSELRGKPAFPTAPGSPYWVHKSLEEAAYEWLTSAANLIGIATGQRGIHWEQASDVLAHENLTKGVPNDCVIRMRGLLAATDEDRQRGLLPQIEYTIYAETFDDFLDHAAVFHKSGKVNESAVLASAVLEDTLKKIAKKNGVDGKPTLEPTIDALAAAGVFTLVKAKRVKAWAGVRTAAFHARWDELDLKAVGEMISGVRELIETHL